jgi:hypothetical protein
VAPKSQSQVLREAQSAGLQVLPTSNRPIHPTPLTQIHLRAQPRLVVASALNLSLVCTRLNRTNVMNTFDLPLFLTIWVRSCLPKLPKLHRHGALTSEWPSERIIRPMPDLLRPYAYCRLPFAFFKNKINPLNYPYLMSLHPKPPIMLASLFAVRSLKTAQVQCRPMRKRVSSCLDIGLRPDTMSYMFGSNFFG